MKRWLKRLHRWSLQWANTKWGALALFLCAFADASFFGLPTPLLFLALVLLNVTKAYRYVLIGTLGTLAGAIAGYSICLLYTSPSPRDGLLSRMPSSA